MAQRDHGEAGVPAAGAEEIRLGAFVLDLAAPELRRHGVPVAIRATPLRLLVALARRAGEVVPKEQLIGQVWPDVAVSDASLSTALRELRAVLGDDGRRQRVVQTLRHRGYRLVLDGFGAPSAVSRPAGASPPTARQADVDGTDRSYGVLTRLGSKLFEAGRHEDARAAYREAARAARRDGDPARFVRAALDFAGEVANTETAVHSEERVALLEEALAHEDAVAPSLGARLRARLALDLAWVRRDEAVALASDAAARARAAGDPQALAHVLHDVYWTLWSPDTLAERRDLAREMVGAAEAAGDRFAAAFAHLLEGAALLECADRAGAEEATERAFECFRTREHAGVPAWRSGWQACMALLDGRFREAERHAEEALRRGQALGASNATRIFALQLGWLRFDQGRSAELARFADALQGPLPILRAGAALVAHASGREAEARSAFAPLVDDLDGFPRDPFWLGTLALLAELAVRVGDPDRATRLHDVLRPYEAQCVLVGARSACRGSVALYCGLLARTARRDDAVVPHLENAVLVNARLRAAPLLARAQLELARGLAARGRGDDAARALDLLSGSAALHRGLNLRHRDDEIAALRARLGR